MPQDHPDGTMPAVIVMADIKVPMDLQGQTLTLDMNIKAADAKVGIHIEAQSVGVYLQPEWAVLQGEAKTFVASGAAASGANQYVQYTVPAGKTLYITLVTFSSRGSLAADRDKPQMVRADIIDDAYTVFYEGGNGGGGLALTTPLKCDAESDMYFRVTNWSNHDCDIAGLFRGYEI